MTTTAAHDTVVSLDGPAPRGHHVRVRGARRHYGQVTALDGVDIDIEPGRFLVLLGPSGSGKTTLLRGIAGIERFDEGSIHFGDRVIGDDRISVPAEKRDVAMVFQDYALWPHMTIAQNVGYALRRRHLGATRTRQLAHEALDRVGLTGMDSRYPNELSGGQQQRVALARAVVAEPSLLLFDEPLSNLDADLRERLRVEISTLTRESGATALYITHDQAEAFALADEIAVLRAGQLEQRGTPEEIFLNPRTPFVARFTGLAGSVSGVPIGPKGAHLRVRLGEHEVVARSLASIVGSAAPVDVLIRPTATRLVPVGAGPSRQDVHSSIPGRVIDIAFRGRGYEHVVETPYGRLSSVFDESPWGRGTPCALALDPNGCLAFPAEPA
jgi:iron(III) transport system ATP-binding protein